MTEQTETGARVALDTSALAEIKRLRQRSGLAISLGAVSLAVSSVLLANSLFGPIRITFGDAPQQAVYVPPTPAVIAAPATVAAPVAIAPVPPLAAAPAAPMPGPDDIRVATFGEKAFAFDRLSNTYFAFDAQMQPIPVDPATIPPQALAQLQSPAAVVGDTDAQFAAAAEKSAAIAAGDTLSINAMLSDKEVATNLLAMLERQGGIDIDGAEGMEHRVFVFFDASCPYCHQLYLDMDGAVDSKWLPTLALGPNSGPMVEYIMGKDAISTKNGANGKVESISVTADPDRAARLRKVVGGGEKPAVAYPISAEAEFVTQENETLMRYFYGPQSHLIAVPTIIVEKPDGTAVMLRGYEDTTVKQIREIQGRG